MYQCYLTSVEKLLTYVDLYTPKSLRRTVLIYFGDIVMYICWGRARASAPKCARSKSMSNSYVSLFYLDILIPCKISPPKISNWHSIAHNLIFKMKTKQKIELLYFTNQVLHCDRCAGWFSCASTPSICIALSFIRIWGHQLAVGNLESRYPVFTLRGTWIFPPTRLGRFLLLSFSFLRRGWYVVAQEQRTGTIRRSDLAIHKNLQREPERSNTPPSTTHNITSHTSIGIEERDLRIVILTKSEQYTTLGALLEVQFCCKRKQKGVDQPY